MSNASQSRIGEKFDEQFEEAIINASSAEEIKHLLHSRAVEAGIVRQDFYNAGILHEVPEPEKPTRYYDSIEFGGRHLQFEGDSELDVARKVTEFFRQRQKDHPAMFRPLEPEPEPAQESVQEQQPRDESGRFAAQEQSPADDGGVEAARQAELRLRFARGELGVDDYLRESGAIERHLEKTFGVTPQDLREMSSRSVESAWKSATDSFIEAHPDWQGGQAVLDEMTSAICELGLENKPSVETLEAAYEHLVQTKGGVPENPEVTRQSELHRTMSESNSPEEIRRAARQAIGMPDRIADSWGR